ncbi:hypothetical protein G7Y89_g10045 [Cudoniella acicularis]|uniref:Rhodopsin domain-containing protein n=1 Tax=Cudoniella acicularis TaxID=354080 RepID=A0A8H4REJ0_9HELO|nr:hypothetical protein G7Y89_g10045 [Cudoniella acicularis]
MSTTSYQGMIVLSTVLPALCLVVVPLRFYARLRQKAELKFDDWAQIPSLLLFIGMSIACLIGVANKAFGYPDPPGPPTDPAPSTILVEKLNFSIQILQLIELSFIKCSALAFYRRVFCSIRPSILNTVIWVLMSLTVAWAVSFIIFYTTTCGTHLDASWEGDIPFLKYCINSAEKFYKAFAISDFILDTLVLLVPIPSVRALLHFVVKVVELPLIPSSQVWNLKMTFGRKIGVLGIFMMALIGYGSCTARLVVIINLDKATFSQTAPDLQLADTQAIWFSMLETGFTIIAVNLPSLWSMIAKLSPESIIRSVRSIISLRSLPSNLSNGSRGGDPRSYVRKTSASTSQDNIELVAAEDTADFNITIERQGGKRDRQSPDMYQKDLESGIYVQKSVRVASKQRL